MESSNLIENVVNEGNTVIRFDNEDIYMVQQPDNLKKTLFIHQLASIFKLEAKEKNNKIINSIGEVIESSIGIFSDMTGYGKSLSLIGVLCRDKMIWDISEKYDFADICMS